MPYAPEMFGGAGGNDDYQDWRHPHGPVWQPPPHPHHHPQDNGQMFQSPAQQYHHGSQMQYVQTAPIPVGDPRQSHLLQLSNQPPQLSPYLQQPASQPHSSQTYHQHQQHASGPYHGQQGFVQDRSYYPQAQQQYRQPQPSPHSPHQSFHPQLQSRVPQETTRLASATLPGQENRAQPQIPAVAQQRTPSLPQSIQSRSEQRFGTASPEGLSYSRQAVHRPSHAQSQATRMHHSPVSSQRPLAFVKIPSSKSADMPTKRRKSNEGASIPVCSVPRPVASVSQSHAAITSSPLVQPSSSPAPSTLVPNVDYQAILLGLAEEYIRTAHQLSSAAASKGMSDEEVDEYCSLLATGMGCLESILQNYWATDPRKDARIRLRLAGLLFEETENDMQAEELLSKGISSCERNRLIDLKYTMHHLLVRVMFKSRPAAALKTLDNLVPEVEALKQFHWVFTFRFLRVSLAIQLDGHSQTASVLRNLTAISTLAENQKLVGVQIITALLEAFVHLRSGSVEAVELAQRSLASARTHQLGPEMQQMPQAQALLYVLDLMCALLSYNHQKAKEKMQHLQKEMDPISKKPGWNIDGTFKVSLGAGASDFVDDDTTGIMSCLPSGQFALTMQFATSSELYIFAYFLSGLVGMHKNCEDNKAVSYIQQGLKCTYLKPASEQLSLNAAAKKRERLEAMRLTLRLNIAIAFCASSDWTAATTAIKEAGGETAAKAQQSEDLSACMLQYLSGVCKQANGELRSALDLYRSPPLAFRARSRASYLKDIQTLSTINSILILRTLTDGDKVQASQLLSEIEQYCLDHNNRAFSSAFHIIKATSQDSAIIKTKQWIQTALKAAQAVDNKLFTCIIMNVMTELFFEKIVGEQAVKSGSAGRTLATKAKNHLWTAVADGMYGETLERCGELSQASAARAEGQRAAELLPDGVKRHLWYDGAT